MSALLSFSTGLIGDLRASPCNFVVTGANGWLGSATLTMLRHALGDDFAKHVTALGSRQSHSVQAMFEWKPPHGQPLIIFHYAFLTKDRVSGLSTRDYVERNEAISNLVRSWIESSNVIGVVLPSSGAVYDHLRTQARDPSACLYGQLKFKDELDFTAACESHDTRLIIARVFNLSGPYINKFDSYALSSFVQQVIRRQPITIHARHPVFRSYYFIGDLLELCVRLLFKPSTERTEYFDVAGDEIIELGELALRVVKVLSDNMPIVIHRQPMFSGDVTDRYIGNSDRIKELEIGFGMHPMTLDRQIELTSQYIQRVLRN